MTTTSSALQLGQTANLLQVSGKACKQAIVDLSHHIRWLAAAIVDVCTRSFTMRCRL